MTSNRIAQICICAALAIAPISGGFVSTELQTAGPGFSFITALFGSADAPMLGLVLPTLLLVIAGLAILVSRKVVQVPFPNVTMAGGIFAATIIGTVAVSEFRALSLATALQWIVVIAAPFAIVATLGRGRGPTLACLAISIGCAVIAGLGILEFAATSDPNWRVFCNWVNPNAAAGMLLLGLFPACSLLREPDRLWKLGGGACAVLIATAILLTQSKGGIVALGVGGFATLVFSFALNRPAKEKFAPIVMLLGVGVLAIGLTKAIQSSAAARAGTAPVAAMGRLGASADTQEQSNEFRILLWKSSIELIKRNPIGSGPGTFRYESTRPGLVSQTHHAHQGFLQLGVESGVASLVALLAFLVVVALETFRGARKLPPERTRLLIGVLGSIAATVAHNLIDSDLQHFGTGFTFFGLLGLALLLAHDGVTPEFLPKPVRFGGVAGAVAIAITLIYFAQVDTLKSQARGALMAQSPEAGSIVQSLKSMAPGDPEVWSLAVSTATDRESAVANAARAAELGPSMRNQRLLARLLFAQGDTLGATSALEKALRRDPNNLPALLLLMQFYEASEQSEMAQDTARKLVAVEQSSVYRIRAIPESVPTQTFEARRLLAEYESNPKTRRELLFGAAKGYGEFAARTVPEIVKMATENPSYQFAGDGVADAQRNMTLGKEIVSELRKLQGPGSPTSAELDALDDAFSAALDSLANFAK